MSDNNPIVVRDYIDNFAIKEMTLNELAPKYFEGIDLNKLNVGLTGYVMEQISNISEDTFNTVSTLMKEMFPNRAQIPESIYSHAAIFQLSNIFAVPSECTFILMVNEEDLINNSTFVNGYYQFILDENTIIQVEDKLFVLDYDIIIRAQKHLGEWVFSSQYNMTYDNAVSTIKSPYIKTRRSNNGYLGLFINARQFSREITYETIINNSKINFPVIDVAFNNQLAGFDVFYKPPTSSTYTQLTKRLMYTQPLKTPFCYYTISSDNTLRISFSSKESSFQPVFNSELMIYVYTTNGSSGNFEAYTGNQVTLIPTGEKYANNDIVPFTAKPLTASINGMDKLDIDALQSLTVESYSTAKSLTTENDLELYFNNYKYRYGNEIKFIKKRDDIIERLFSAFLILKKDDFIYSTNTLFVNTDTSLFDINDNNSRFVLKPGHLFRYKSGYRDTVEIIPDKMVYDDLSDINEDFLYTNPFLISLNRSPNLVGFYMTMVNQDVILDYSEMNPESFIQFVINKINIQRGLNENNFFEVTLTLMPSITLEEALVKNIGDTNNQLRVIMTFDDNGEEIGYIELIPTEYDETSGTYTFKVNIETDDYITSKDKFRCLNAVKSPSSESDYVYIPMSNCKINIYTLLQIDTKITWTRTNSIIHSNPEYSSYTITNVYRTEDEHVTFIRPLNLMRSTVSFTRVEGDNKLHLKLDTIPFIKYDIVNDDDKLKYLISSLTLQYKHLENVLTTLNNNMHIDLKFYNTYGMSKNFVVGDNSELLDKVNMSISFKINPVSGINNYDLLRDLKIFIKNYIEKVNNNGTNDFYVSNLIREIENNFPSVHHQRFLGINSYSTDVQTVRNMTNDISTLSKDERRHYVPELLVVDIDDIDLFTYE